MSSNEVIKLINGFGLIERLMIVEEILRTIRKENVAPTNQEHASDKKSGPPILGLAGVIDEAEASVLTSAIEESRKIDHDGW
jgi:hypothetical protein